MRGRSSNARSRLRSAGYKCNLCGRRLIDAASLERHQKTIHNISPRDNRLALKARTSVPKKQLTAKEKDKVFDELLKKDVEGKPKKNSKNDEPDEVIGNSHNEEPSKELETSKNSETVVKEGKSKKKDLGTPRRVEFECPVCEKTFNVYFTAHKHIQKHHSCNADGKKVAPNSPDLVQPIRIEMCHRCNLKMRSNASHTCPKINEEALCTPTDFICSGCNQSFVSLKTFDMHVAGLHSDSVESLFFPTKIEFTNWRLEMEWETHARYTLYGEYESKKIYRCNYARQDGNIDKSTAYFCPSSMVLQEFSKGIQVHFYNKHFDHTANPYTLYGKYKKYSIQTYLKNPNESSSTAMITPTVYAMQLDDKDLYSQFKTLMDGIVKNSTDIEISVLKTLVDKALDMSAVLTEATGGMIPKFKPKAMTDKEISEALGVQMRKRRGSVDSCEVTSKAGKRTRNKSLVNQNDESMSPKILNTFSLASNSNSDDVNDDRDDDLDSTASDKAARGSKHGQITPDQDVKPKTGKAHARLTSSLSLSFNDSYKDFIDKNFIGKEKDMRVTRNKMKTKLGEFKQTSPGKLEMKHDSYDIVENNKALRQIKPISSVNAKCEETPTPKVKTISMETPKLNILSVDTPNVTITKVGAMKTDSPNSQINKDISKQKPLRGISSNLNPYEVIITKGKTQKLSGRRPSSPLLDPLELDIASKHISPERNFSNVTSFSPPIDPVKFNTTKVGAPKPILKTNSPKIITPKVYSGPGTPKVSPKIETDPKQTFKGTRTTPKLYPSNIKELKYEVREQKNDCNILVLKC